MWVNYKEGGILVTWHQLANPFNMTGTLLLTRCVLLRRELVILSYVSLLPTGLSILPQWLIKVFLLSTKVSKRKFWQYFFSISLYSWVGLEALWKFHIISISPIDANLTTCSIRIHIRVKFPFAYMLDG